MNIFLLSITPRWVRVLRCGVLVLMLSGVPTLEGEAANQGASEAAWQVAFSFADEPNAENTKVALELLRDKLRNWESVDGAIVRRVLNGIGAHHVVAGKQYLFEFTRIDPGRGGAEQIIADAVIGLGEFGGEDALARLIECSEQFPEHLTWAVAVGLGTTESPDAVSTLEDLAQRSPFSRSTAIEALTRFCSGSSKDLVLTMLEQDDRKSRIAASGWIAKCGEKHDTSILSRLLSDPSPEVRRRAIIGLKRLEAMDGCDKVNSLLADESAEVRAEASDYLQFCATAN